MARRPTIRDVAARAGVSVATVNRVLAGGGKVRAGTAKAVAEAAHDLGYHAANLIDQRLVSTSPEVTLGLLVHKGAQAFSQALAEAVAAAAARQAGVRARVILRSLTSQAPADQAAAVAGFAGDVDVLAATVIDHPFVSEAVEGLQGQGVETFALLSDFALGTRRGYGGLDNYKVGRGAARVLAGAARKPGKMAIIVGGGRWQGHGLRETGFRDYFDGVGGWTVLDRLTNLQTRALTRETVLDLLERHDDLAGIYVAGAGMEGAIAALREASGPGDVALVVHEHTDQAAEALRDGYAALTIATPLDRLCEALVDRMVACALDHGREDWRVLLAPELHLPEFA